MLERWNTHFSKTVEQELFGITLQLAQDPSSNNLGTTVWDASIVLAKYIEKNSRRGDFSRPKVRGKRVLELGAGMGLAGMAMALLGCEVAFTDIGDVLTLLRHNVEQNVSPAALKLKDAAWAAQEVGSCQVASLDWSDPTCYAAFQPPYDFILAADCVYSELAVPHLLATVLHMGGPRTQTIVTNEFRSQSVHDVFMETFGQHFMIRKVQSGKMDPNYQHPLIHIYLLKRRKPAAGEAGSEAGDVEAAAAAAVAEAGAEEAQAIAGSSAAVAEAGAEQVQGAAGSGAGGGAAASRSSLQGGATAAEAAQGGAAGGEGGSDLVAPDEARSGDGEPNPGSEASARSEQQFKTRREGSMLARMLAEVKI
ncbi:hypothetical protein ABPG77_010607 [Micractinium sp. CCAP 211/92]